MLGGFKVSTAKSSALRQISSSFEGSRIAAADYDGMCRPRQYQEFVFVRGNFAGTLAPRPMDSRTDGALGRVTIETDRRVQAEYARYDAADPLCCPSRTTRVVFDIGKEPPVLEPVSVMTVLNRST